jgi:hypothetical protein
MFQLHGVIRWWQALPEVDRASVDNVNQLIHGCEGIITTEQNGWHTASMAAGMEAVKLTEKKKDVEVAKGGEV